MNEQENKPEIRHAFLASRNGAIVRCASIMVNSGRKDIAKEILKTTKIDKNTFQQLKAQNS